MWHATRKLRDLQLGLLRIIEGMSHIFLEWCWIAIKNTKQPSNLICSPGQFIMDILLNRDYSLRNRSKVAFRSMSLIQNLYPISQYMFIYLIGKKRTLGQCIYKEENTILIIWYAC